MKASKFSECLAALEQNDFATVEQLLQGLDNSSHGPATRALAREIKVRLERKQAQAGGVEPGRRSKDHFVPKSAPALKIVPPDKSVATHAPLARSNREEPSTIGPLTVSFKPGDSGFLLSQRDAAPPLPGISLVAACMNREENLLKVLDSWLATDVDEIVIVDWSSASELWPQLSAIADPRLKVIRIDGEKRWILTHALNVGLRGLWRPLIDVKTPKYPEKP
jgi:hypothetical protein